jgi:hypothetical protein
MTITIRPSRRGNFDVTGQRLAELGVRYSGYDHHANSYVDVVIPSGIEAALGADPLVEVEWDATVKPRKVPPAWSSPESGVDLTDVGARLRKLRVAAGWDLLTAAALTGDKVSADTIERIETTGNGELRDLIVLADLYGASIDRLAGRSVAHGDRRR